MIQKQILTLDKQLETDDFEIPTVTYRITSRCERPFKLRLQETVPEPFEPTELRFQSEDECRWEVDDRCIAFEDQLEPEDTRVTVCGIKTDSHEQLSEFGGQPTIEIAPIAADGGDSDTDWQPVSEDLFEFVDIHVSNQLENVPTVKSDGGTRQSVDEAHAIGETGASESDSPTGECHSTKSLETSIPPASISGSQSSMGHVDEFENEDAPNVGQTQSEKIVEYFLTVLQEGSLSNEQQETIREALRLDTDESVNARIRHCQTRVSDLTSYIDALEEFLDEEGTSQQLFEEIQTDIEDIEEQVSTIQSDVSTMATQQDELRKNIAEVEEELSALDTIDADVDAVETQLEDTTTSLETEIETLRSTIEDIEDWQDTVANVFAGGSTKTTN